MSKDNLFVLVLELETSLRKVQRRQFFRYDMIMPVKYMPLDEALTVVFDRTGEIPEEIINRNIMDGQTIDISGGGMKFVGCGFKKGDRVYIEFDYMLGAAKQSKRMQIPTVHMPVTFQQALAMMAESDVRLMPYENAEGMEGTRKILESIEPGESIAVLIGPEGGIDEAEVEMAMKAKVEPITLGKRILRTETAGMTVLSILVYLLEGRERTR